MKKILLIAFAGLTGFTQAQIKKKSSTTQKSKIEKKWVNPVKLTKEERSRPYMDEVLKTRDTLTSAEAERRRKNIAVGNPFAKYGVYPKIATLSKGKYLEFHDLEKVVNIGSVKFDRRTKEIIEFRKIDLSDPDAQPYLDTAGRWVSPDPLSEEYSDWSPYHIVYNNPISNIDPDGRQILDNFQLLQNGQVKLIERTNDSSDTLFASDKNGNVDKSKSVTVDKPNANSGSIISELASGGIPDNTKYPYMSGRDGEKMFPLGINRGRTTNASDAGNVFLFAANNSNVEWGLAGYETGKNMTYALWTGHSDDRTPSSILYQGISKLSFEIHTHPGDVTTPSAINSANNGDYGPAGAINNIFYKNGSSTYPRHFMYSQKKHHLWEYNYTSAGSAQYYPGRPGTNKPMPVGSSINLKALKK
ncbi:JAB-like toxin 1 domain-containing protein [Chryseobacterium rhizosphaerae]|uniref:JAB-like toxin 1 domain-containing protein n=1 Tax=Chryseobacterium rhizosphaerae TaxID=395937 RepID=UPI002358B71A|nr:JAB-like toxin 1 domain-containing protein [Chryseobacterium rhizosphaerae]MDC8099138.1 hypothetical protein [Chryseobacterium rhizosphaerae]